VPEQELLTGWGRTAPTAAKVSHLGADSASVAAAVTRVGDRGILARGLGRSYGDAAQNAGGEVLLLDRAQQLHLDATAGVVHVDAGVSLDRLIRELLPHGFFVSVTPGTRFVTVGGAIAADIHGKNHHVEGSFSEHVVEMTLVTADGRTRVLTPEGTPELFWATVGGMGLTGVITAASLRVKPVETAYIRVDTDRTANLAELVDLMRRTDDDYTYSVAWIDLLAKGDAMGRAVLTRGEHARTGDLSERLARRPLEIQAAQRLRAPGWAPNHLMNHWTVKAFNEAWFRKAPRTRRDETTHLAAFFHPLDGVAEWNRLYGSRGLVQYQFAVPASAEEALTEAVRRIAAAGHASFLAVLKRFGPGNPGMLSFPQEGWTLALDLPADPGLAPLLDALDALVLEAGGRIYLAKDARARPETLRRMYPRLEEFQEVRRRIDPGGVFTSDLARRLHL
jgi:decaprenylphospho-beta-D-ribofuranose 2-oxidase